MRLSTHRRAVLLTAAAIVVPMLPVVLGGASATAAAPVAQSGAKISFTRQTPGRLVPVRGSGLGKASTVAAVPSGSSRASIRRAGTTANISVAGALSDWQVSFAGGTQEQQDAFTRATMTWSNLVASSVPITVSVTLKAQADDQVLGSAGPSNLFSTDTPLPGVLTNTFYPVALANALSGTDEDPTGPDIVAEFNSDPTVFSFADGPPAANEYDFETVALHELGHGLGFLGNISVFNKPGAGLVGGWDVDAPSGEQRLPFIFDRRVLRVNPVPSKTLFSLGQDSPGLAQAMTTGDVVFGGPQLTELRPCAPIAPKLYTPATFVEGTSYSHLDEASFGPGSANSLMTPFINEQEVVHDPGPIVLAMLRDMGWQAQRRAAFSTLQQCAPKVVNAGTSAVTLKGTAPAGSAVQVYFRRRTETQYVLRRTALANAVGYWSTTFSPTDDWAYATAAAGKATTIAVTAVRPTVAGATVRSIRRNTRVTLSGRGAVGTVVQLRFRLQSTTTAGYPIIRNVKVNASGVWGYPITLTQNHQFIAFGVNGLSSPTVLYKAV